MNHKVIYSTLLILLASCTSELPITPDLKLGQEQEVPVQFYISTNPLENQESRAAIEGKQLDLGSHVGIFALEGKIDANGEFKTTKDSINKWNKDNIRENFTNAEYVVKDLPTVNYHKLEPTGPIGTYPSNGALQFYAYYPYSNTIKYDGTKVPKLNIEIDTLGIEVTKDYLYTGPITSTSKDNSTNLKFEHALGMLNIYVCTDLPFMDEEDINQIPYLNEIIVYTKYSQKGTMDLSSGIITRTFGGSNNKFTKKFESPHEVEDYENLSYIIWHDRETIEKAAYSNMFIPNESCINSITLNITRNGKTDTITIKDNLSIYIKKGEETNLYIKYNPKDYIN